MIVNIYIYRYWFTMIKGHSHDQSYRSIGHVHHLSNVQCISLHLCSGAAHGPAAQRPKGDCALEYCTSLPAWTLAVSLWFRGICMDLLLAKCRFQAFRFLNGWFYWSVFPPWRCCIQSCCLAISMLEEFLPRWSLPLRWLNSAWQTRGGGEGPTEIVSDCRCEAQVWPHLYL